MMTRACDFPLAERGLFGFVGFVYASLITCIRRKFREASLPNNVSGIRLTINALGFRKLQTAEGSLGLVSVWPRYAKAAGLEIPPTAISLSIPAHALCSILNWAARPNATKMGVCDAVIAMTAAVFELRGASAKSAWFEHIKLDEERLQVPVGSLKAGTL